jgi:hypothetical protein
MLQIARLLALGNGNAVRGAGVLVILTAAKMLIKALKLMGVI